ncbi:uncharacterized protein A1O9_12664 [Exophiala aquamarina CBS 119918]|uniref:Zn(2)-C6 fungal-type domain-containing protein n=1 Tax=Exophiala aquamarina CBS 119918 TaxID=1182545 RepID=A0A072NTY9_9EURO|nr:uncharacterized protein A1O9_12664 [Exophiala aquamarina CBS 119918]KEF51314.1 hypothetical protein A1O9_12664 [Exophiala aquamarina CBS 119918]
MISQREGCHNCSQRRIKCDLTRPQCNKCLRKGLECPGYGIRYRFNTGIASRGKLKGRTIPIDTPVASPAQHGQMAAPALLWPDGSVTRTQTQGQNHELAISRSLQSPSPAESSLLDCWDTQKTFNIFDLALGDDFVAENDNIVDSPRDLQAQSAGDAIPEICETCLLVHPPNFCCFEIPNSLQVMGPQSRELFAHFSSSVAPVMVVLDGKFNGYRDLILPLACEDDLVKGAVSVVSMYHLAPLQPEMQFYADSGLQSIIRQLLERTSQLENALDLSAWATIIVLLVGETITGGCNLPFLFKILQHLAEANTKLGHESVMHSFLREQTRMMTLFAQPLLGETAGTMTLRTPLDVYFDFISNAAIFHPGLAPQIGLYKTAIRQACSMYLRRVMQNPPLSESSVDLESLKVLCARIHPNTPGHHTLVWVYFVAAAESVTLAHREFFTLRLQEVFSRTRFHNIPTALAALQKLWKVQAERRWTEVLPEIMPVFII